MNILKGISAEVVIATILVLSPLAGAMEAGWQEKRVATRTVSVSDLDLSTPVGQKMLHHRLRTAARQVCREISPVVRGRYFENARCNREVLEETIARLPVVTIPSNQRVAGGTSTARD